MLTTPQSIRTLQRKLYRKAKQEPAFRFYALYDKVYRADILSHAYRLVRANKGGAGVDGVTFAAIESAEGQTAFIAELQEALKSKSYRYKVRGKWLGYIKFPNRLLYQRYGLYKVPTTAGWKMAHAVR